MEVLRVRLRDLGAGRGQDHVLVAKVFQPPWGFEGRCRQRYEEYQLDLTYRERISAGSTTATTGNNSCFVVGPFVYENARRFFLLPAPTAECAGDRLPYIRRFSMRSFGAGL